MRGSWWRAKWEVMVGGQDNCTLEDMLKVLIGDQEEGARGAKNKVLGEVKRKVLSKVKRM